MRARYVALFPLLILTTLLVSCARSTPTPPPTVFVEEATPTPAPSPTAAVTPTEEVMVTPTAASLPPVVVDTRPAPGDEAPPDAAIEIVFSQPVDPASVQDAIQVQPQVEGQVEVEGPIVRFVPRTPFPRETWVTVRVGQKVRGTNGLPLLRPVLYRYVTQGTLQVTRHSPRDRAQHVPITSTVQIAFNRAIVSLDTTNQPTEPPPWLHIQPEVAGTVRWVGTSLLEFTPDPAFRASTTYAVTVSPPLDALDGAPLTEPVTFTFATDGPRVLDVTFARVSKTFIYPDRPITVTFNMPMDPTSAEDNVYLVRLPDETPVPVDLTWPDPATLVVSPRAPLTLNGLYRLEIDTGLRAADRVTPLTKRVEHNVRVVPPISVKSSRPSHGDANITPGGVGMWVAFYGIVDEASLAGNVEVVPEPTTVFTYYNAYQGRLWINFEAEAQTTYTVTLKAGIADIFGNTLGEDVHIRFTTGDYIPGFNVLLPWGAAMFDTTHPVTVPLQARNIAQATVRLYRPTAEQAVTLAQKDPWELSRLPKDALGEEVRTWDILFPARRNVWHRVDVVLTDEAGHPLPAGVYVVEVETPRAGKMRFEPQYRLFVVSPYNLMMKVGEDEVLVWATDLRTGQPVPGLPLRVMTNAESADIVTDAEGLARVTFKYLDPWERVTVLAHSDRPDGLVVRDWNDGISPWNFRLNQSYRGTGALVAHILTERPVYRPGQTIHWKLIVRVDNDGVYELPPPGTTVHVEIADPNGDPVFSEDVKLNEMGTASRDLPLADNAPLGFYYFWLEGAEMLKPPTLLVTAYRKPEFEITVAAEPPEVISGETVRVRAEARYFFGAPVANARVEYVITDEPYTFHWECPQAPCPPYSFSDYNWWEWEPFQPVGEPLARGSGRTDENGVFTLSLPATLKEDQNSRRWTVEITVFDVSGQVISGRTHVVVHKAAVYPGVVAREYVARVGTPVTADIILVDTEGTPVPNAAATFVALRQTWHNVRKKFPDGVFRWISEVEETPVYTETVRLDGEGRGTATFTPTEGGSYRLRVIAQDAQGRTATASSYLWVSSSTYIPWRRENNDRLFLIVDRTTYQVGDTAQVMVPSPYPGPVEALVTLERGSIRQVWRTTLQTNSDIIEVPITADMAPNVFLSVFIVQGSEAAADGLPSFKLGYVELAVDASAHVLDVQVTPEHEKYRPRDTARFTLTVRDHEGNPVDAEVAVALVDKAVLSLFERPTPLVQIFYRKRGLGVGTAATLTKNIGRMLQQQEKGGKGGGGGGGGPAPTVREEFLDVVYWQPDLRTGPQGRATIEARLPDNLTTWTLLAWAVDAQTRVGEGSADILVTQDFLLRPVLPRFFSVVDEARIGVVAHNLSDVPLRATVTISATGATLADAPAQEVALGPGQKAKLTWTVTDVRGVQREEGLTFTAFWQGTTDVSGVADAVRLTIPVRYPAPPDVVATAGMVEQDTTQLEVVVLPRERVPDAGNLRLDLDASLASGMLDSLTYLKHYPWECAEQTISRFFPNVVTWRALKRLGVSNPDLEQAIPDLVYTAVQKLSQQQNPDGGWGWWGFDESNAFITAYGLLALTEADQAGFSVDRDMMDRAARFLYIHLRGRTPGKERWRNNRAAFVLFALATYRSTYGQSTDFVYARAVTFFEARERLDVYGKALLGLTFGILADTARKADARDAAREYLATLLDDIQQAAVLDPTGAHWEEATVDWWNMNNDVRTTALVVLLMARYDPENPLAPNAVRWLMSTRKGDRWNHTQDTAWAVVALTDWMEQTGELHPDYNYTAWLNSTVWLSGTMTPADVGETKSAVVPITDLRPDEPNVVQIERTRTAAQTGEGALYYRLTLTTLRPLEKVTALSRGITVERWYTKGDDDTPITRARVGDIVTVHLRVIAPRGLTYFMLEDPLPAGVEPLDVRLLTTTQQAKGPEVEKKAEGKPAWWRWWYWQPTHSELRDDRAGFFQTWLSPGTYEITYQVRASIPGTFVVGPATASQMYAPEVFGRTGTTMFIVED